jgi:isoleucyl-tRNA synthetase
MSATILRQEIHNILDDIPDQSLPALKPLLKHLAEEYWKPVIEPANEEEIALIKDGMKEYRENPSSFVALTERE